jgi:hypothetical protein
MEPRIEMNEARSPAASALDIRLAEHEENES